MRYFLRRVGYFLLTLWAAVTLNFLIPRLQPGDPAEMMVKKLAGKDAELDPAKIAAMRAMLGAPEGTMFDQYVAYLRQLLSGNLGVSYNYFPTPVTDVIAKALPWTLILVGVTLLISFAVGTVLGALAAWRRNSLFDSIVTIGSTFIGTLQAFWIALLLLFAFGYILGWFPTSGGYDATTPGFNLPFIGDALYHSVLPAAVLLLLGPIGWVLGMRNTMIMNLGEDYIRLAKAKGVPDSQVALRYAARNALLPSITGLAMALGGILGGQLLIENIFDYPGLGRIMGQAATGKDYPLLQALLLFTITATLIANLIADLLYGVLDPRARKASA
ncbi:MAG: ABC transporter permease [Propionibacteriaceae bacterium]